MSTNISEKVEKILATRYKNYQIELAYLRQIILSTSLIEDVKWGAPCYTYQGKNVVIIGSFKNYFVISFLEGSLLKDEFNLLIQQTKNVQSGRIIKFTTLEDVLKIEKLIPLYINEAIANINAGKKVNFKTTNDFEKPIELINRLENDQIFNVAFNNLTPGRQRGYILYFSSAKQAKTRMARIDKYYLKILENKGLND